MRSTLAYLAIVIVLSAAAIRRSGGNKSAITVRVLRQSVKIDLQRCQSMSHRFYEHEADRSCQASLAVRAFVLGQGSSLGGNVNKAVLGRIIYELRGTCSIGESAVSCHQRGIIQKEANKHILSTA